MEAVASGLRGGLGCGHGHAQDGIGAQLACDGRSTGRFLFTLETRFV